MYDYVNYVKFATFYLVSYLLHVIFFFQFIVYFFLVLCVLLAIKLCKKIVLFGTFSCCVCLPELCTSQRKPPQPRNYTVFYHIMWQYVLLDK